MLRVSFSLLDRSVYLPICTKAATVQQQQQQQQQHQQHHHQQQHRVPFLAITHRVFLLSSDGQPQPGLQGLLAVHTADIRALAGYRPGGRPVQVRRRDEILEEADGDITRTRTGKRCAPTATVVCLLACVCVFVCVVVVRREF